MRYNSDNVIFVGHDKYPFILHLWPFSAVCTFDYELHGQILNKNLLAINIYNALQSCTIVIFNQGRLIRRNDFS